MAELSKAIARLMEERTQAPAATSQPRQFFERVRERVAPGDRPAAEAFARLLLARAAPELAERTSDELLAALCVGAFHFITPPAEEPRVRVFDPDFSRDGWDAPVTVVETSISDRPFVVDTVREALHQAGYVARLLLHPIVGCERDAQGTLVAVSGPERSLRQESFVHAQIDRLPDAAARAALEDDLRRRLRDLLLATNDYQAMRQAAALLASELRGRGSRPSEPPPEEIAAFLDWLTQGNFVFLGYRAYVVRGEGQDATVGVQPGSGLGFLRKERSTFAAQPRLRDLDPTLRRRILSGPPLVITKTTAESPVHRRARMDYVGIRQYDAQGRVAGEKRFIGLLTSRAYGAESAEVPLLRRKLQRILEIESAPEGSHDNREILGLFNSFPKEHLLAGTAEEIHRDIQVIRTAPSDDVRVTVRLDQLERGLFVLVAFPRESYSAELRRRIESMVARVSGGTILDQHVAMEEGEHVRLHFYVAAIPEAARRVRAEALQAEVRELLRTWDDRLRDALEGDTSHLQPRALARQYAAIFSHEYKAATEIGRAVADIRHVEALVGSGQAQVDLFEAAGTRHTIIKLYLMNEEMVLSDFLPVLENLGLRVFGENRVDVRLSSSSVVHVHAFEVEAARPAPGGDAGLDLERVGGRLADAILAHRAGRLVDDELGSLVLSADLTWQQVHVLRAYANHLVQCGLASRATAFAALTHHPRSTRAAWDYFVARFDPAGGRLPRERLAGPLAGLEQAFLETLEEVESARDDGILRALLSTLAASTRTNAFHRRDDEPVAFKLAPEGLAHVPRPQPRFEIYVFGTAMEGVHLRAGKVARGGIRLSDRPDDYRTEILDLMKTQVVKNAVIVPTGAKGGFSVRRRGAGVPGGGDVLAAYRAFVGALLSLTDNVVQGRVVAPPGVLYDEPDSYLVVAADKGTAALSDVANEVAAQRGFWLADAFASGGSRGYDHKALGITARGAWECVRRHFREMGGDADRDPITVVGIGDMSGDVFGNGLLQSQALRLVAAFNHRHIFLDPEPDAAVAYAERARLFALPGSSWDDYRRDALSPGGGVYPRAAKKVPLSAEARAVLGVEAESLSGDELVRAILRAQVDLLWNGGIGTYVKAAAESNADVGDTAHDAVRVNGVELRARVVAEGGNLGFTQLGRIEYAIAGGRIDTDAIDNAGGVSLSDREVNLKILFGPLLESGEMTGGERDRILVDLTQDVVEQVLETNRRQARALSLDQGRSQSRLPQFLELARQLEREAGLDRTLHRLPDKDALRRRRAVYLGLTRPELAVLLAHAKLHLQHRLLASSLPDDPYAERHLQAYFPRPVSERHRHAVRNHRLRREIIAVELAGALIDLLGVTFVPGIAAEVGCEDVEVVRTWTAAGALMDLDKILDDAAAAALPVAAEQRLLLFLEGALERACKWLLRAPDAGAPIGETVHRYLAPAFELAALLPDILHPEGRQRYAATVAELDSAGIGDVLTRRLVNAGYLADLLEVAHIAAATETPLRLAADVFHGTASIVDLDWVADGLAAVPGDRWEKRAADGLLETLVDVRREITRAALSHHGGGSPVDQGAYCLGQYAGSHEGQIAAVRALIDDVKSAARPSLAALVVIMREIGQLGDGA